MTLSVGGRDVPITHPERVLYPATGTTKADVLRYLIGVSAVLLPALSGRPVTRRRWPDGVGASGFMEKNVPGGAPAWLPRVTLRHEDGDVTYPMATDVACLVWLGQVSALELHVPQWRFHEPAAGPESPRGTDRLVIDLDPGAPAGLAEAAVVARTARALLAADGHDSVPVTSGSKGIHVYARAGGDSGMATSTSDYARELARRLHDELPGLVTTTMARAARRGRVFVDWSQNSPAKTTISPFSLRGTPEPAVAAPRTWAEIESPGLAQLGPDQVLARLTDGLDPWSALMTVS